ncbi:endonuclease-reverse transcriptase [Plakobranchus ocellatus]|uniref:Endonuclease-reverse transcriptase n=1 Tax=Plakobranchus ocellatus TaxID=259542 RepID=A0AAV4D7A6_9GAST|nr:endonuclease-reverse transcriptase [Plakobranchus ocellatus]
MIGKRWASAIQDVTTKPKADCDTNHELLVATLKIKLKIKKTTVKPIRYDVKDIGEDFTIETRNRFKTLLMDIEEKEPNEITNAAKNIINETAAKHLKKRSSKKQPWISEDTLIKIKERKEAKAKFGIHAPVYRIIAKEVKQRCKRDKKNYLIGKCREIEAHMKENRSTEMYEEIKNITKTFQPRLGVIKDEKGNILTESKQIVDRWNRYCEEMYSSDSTADQQEKLEETREDEEIHLLPLRSEIEWAIGSLKDGKKPRL